MQPPPLILEHLYYHPKRNPAPASSSSPFSSSPSPQKPLIYFLSSQVGLFCTLHRYEILQYVAFCVWLLSLSMSSRLIYVVAGISASFLFRDERRPWYGWVGPICSSILHLTNICVVSTSWLFWVVLLGTFMHGCLHGHMFSIPWSIYLLVEFLGYMVNWRV